MLKNLPRSQALNIRYFSTSPCVQSSNIYAGLILSRIPIVSKDLSEFESKYYKYQSELEKRLMWTFPQFYYFRKGTLSERRFLNANRGPVTYQPGVQFPKGTPDVKHNRERSQKQELVVPREELSGVKTGEDSVNRPVVPLSRETIADETNDIKSLERKLSRTLYLLVKQNGIWKFPSFELNGNENTFGQIVENNLNDCNDKIMKSWLVSETPTAVLKFNKDNKLITTDEEDIARREFLVKSHIIAGSFEPKKDSSVQDYQWCSKEEVEALIDNSIYQKIESLLSDI